MSLSQLECARQELPMSVALETLNALEVKNVKQTTIRLVSTNNLISFLESQLQAEPAS